MNFQGFFNYLNDHLGKTILHPQYFAKIGEYEAVKEIKRNVKDKIFLDIGCGRQWYRGEIEPLVKKYYALDHPLLKRRYQSVYPVEISADITHLPLFDNSIHRSMMNLVLEHLPDVDKALQEINRVLKRNGLLVIYAVDSYPVHGDLIIYQHFTKKGLKNILQRNGFKVVKIVSFGNFWETQAVNFNVFVMDGIKRGQIFYVLLTPLLIITNLSAFILGRKKIGKDFNIGHVIIARVKSP